jgi:hypothetical protein
MAREELQMVIYNTKEYMRSIAKNVEKVKLLQSRVDELTVKRSKDLDAPVENNIKQDKENLQIAEKILNEDTTFKKTMAS